MAGHSKWHNIRHRKERMDKLRGKLFSKISREIMVAAREGGPDPQTNSKLRIAIKKAKAAGFPSENIEKILLKAQGKLEGEELHEIIYEGYGPYGVAILLEIITDNRNRTASEVRRIFQKFNGNLAESGSVSWIFKRKGIFSFTDVEDPSRLENYLLENLIDYIEDLKVSEKDIEMVVDPENFEKVKDKLDELKLIPQSADISYIAENVIVIDDVDKAATILKLAETLEDHDDVQKVHMNIFIPQEILSKTLELMK
ncbi:MAG: YebC/PmpR family DNA-binding transcriptional regulator [Candidatus Calescibacterium sp.]|nr:YebC/PmpR family DNA-binding transcriptional regulator [Candidatus Calescibacterium sp.]MDW8194729.1 YebC/PmpR family DNA-binding transcriptional regulator [Candidatus Calescibacterium sp.]